MWAPAAAGDTVQRRDPRGAPGAEYLVDGGILPFGLGSLGVFVAARTLLEPPESPRWFKDDEGGEIFAGDTVPEVAVAAYAVGAAGVIGVSPTGPRWYHAKGFAETLLTTLAVTEVAKNSVGRRRPHYDEEVAVVDDRRSFFSGHSSVTAATSVYLGIYLRQHAFAPLRGDDFMPWWELGSYAGLTAATIWVPLTRVQDRRHHLSDVVTGAAVGTGLALSFYAWQESRYRRDLDRFLADSKVEAADDRTRVILVPDLSPESGRAGLSLVGWF